MSFGIDTLLTVIAGVFAIIGVWNQLSNRLAILETKLEYGDDKFKAIDKKFDEVMQLSINEVMLASWAHQTRFE